MPILMLPNNHKYQINFVIYSPCFQSNIGGVVALYSLAYTIDKSGFDCKIFDRDGFKLSNSIFEKYAHKEDINENTVVVYPEVIVGNPLKAKYVVRWILCELGINCPQDIYTSWGKDDFVYHYCTYNLEKDIKNYNIIAPLYINPALKNHGQSRNGYCHIIRKGHKFHKNLQYVHPQDSLFLDDHLSQEILIEIFNIKEYLISYDPYSYINFIAAMCGCIPIIIPIADSTKQEWLRSSTLSIILEKYEEYELKGIAYGFNEVEYARNTLPEARYQQEISIKYGEETIQRFVNDMITIVCAEPEISDRNSQILKVKDIFFVNEPVINLPITELQQLRKEIATQILNISDNELPKIYAGLFGNTYKTLLYSGIQNQNLTQEEQTFVKEILDNIPQDLRQPKAIQHLLISMLYCNSHQLQLLLPSDFSCLPKWFISEYVQFLVSFPGYFRTIGEAKKYHEYIENSINNLHKQIFNNLDYTLGCEITNYFIQRTTFIPPYFNEKNLKNIYVKRAEIIEHFLKIKGLETDYQFTDRPINRKKIRLGILATDFTPSAETFAYLPVYEYLSRDFEVILYPLAETGEPLEQYCQLSANLFKPLPQELSQQVKTIRDDDLDILFIATNVTISTNQFCLLAAHRLARIQVTSGGSVVTTGMRNMDYYISGTLTDPSPTAQEHYQEKLIKLEGSAHCFSYGTEEGKITTPVERNNLGIPEDAVVFTSCANYFKIIPELIETWAKIIIQVPNSVLVLFPFGPNWAKNYPKTQFINYLNSIFINYGLAPERLIVLDPQPVPDRQDMKEYYKIADVYLDSFPFAGTTSLVEPLQVNLPVIARQGNCFRSAMGAAMILTLNIPGLVADSEESYIQLAVTLGNNAELRKQKSDEIKAAMNNNPSFLDSRSYSAKMGNLFQELFITYLAENLEQNLRLREINLIIFPDWTQPEDELGFELQQIIQTLANHPNNEKITLIMHTGDIATEDIEMFLSSVAMNLLLEDLDITDTIDISLVDKLGDMQWQSLLPLIHGRIILDNEDRIALSQAPVSKLESYQLDSWMNQI
ncbi:methyltransferase type 11 [Anabaena sp. UHCC 0451]|uniref:O-linked N-acetylglucosamine transferase, SPINDLY family protein n=1 Tax=Anabaena sp. UHCC 0451 TaxID=2055235 RepID=UPI002B20A4A1|nr:methyltransferase type 11 [Anabaena sp. UHCC 0451]MEA5578500.1 methyltransferase type 11 [Anabaena sp. UHCC 0451]